MATLAKDTPRTFESTGGHPSYNELPSIADDIVYAGAAVGESSTSGTGRPLSGGDNFMGFATEKCDNTGGSAGDLSIKLLDRGVALLSVTGADGINDYDATVYATDDDTFTLTASGATSIGKIKRYDSATGKFWVYFEATSARSI